MSKQILLVAAACLALTACAEETRVSTKSPESLVPAGDIVSTEAGKADAIGNREYDELGGPLHFGAPRVADIADFGHVVAYTFRARAGQRFELTARGVDDPQFDTVLALYGPRNTRTGRYPHISTVDDVGRSLAARIRHTPRRDGIFLVLVTAYDAGRANVALDCLGEDCELPCAVVRLYAPVCGEDGVTYGNPMAAACFDIPVAHEGTCEPSCNDVTCAEGERCELQDVVCITAPCYPQPVCVPDAPSCDGFECEAGSHCELVEVQCIRAPCPPLPMCVPDADPCAAVRCAAGTHCVAQPDGSAACVADENACAAVLCAPNTLCVVQPDGSAACVPANDCFKTGCSGEVCSDEQVFTACIFRPEYECYRSAECTRQADGQCGFTQTPELLQCLGGL